ncbi:hydroxysqualene dehydroxylase HpnE [Alcaligenes sp. SDU_A2]|uniref:hydroxysqualene dehydroxylase HpnE n=1 Tax=Alcaligenes sp. SDU_A2 TaxID=3136634 RepID=UPI00311DBA20
MKVAVIGAGWAGCAAAWALKSQGHAPTVFESARHIGGRARRIYSPKLQRELDNGQHILLGAYTQTLGLLRELGLDESTRLHRQELDIVAAQGDFRLRNRALPAPWHLLAGLLSAQGIGWRQKLKLARFCRWLETQRWRAPDGLTVLQLLDRHGQDADLIRLFWQPLCVAAMNTPIEQACAQLFAHVLRDSLGGPRQASQPLIPLTDLGRLWCEPALHELDVHLGHRVQSLQLTKDGVDVDSQPFDAAILACPPPQARRLLSTLPSTAHSEQLLADLDAMQYVPIATLYLDLNQPWNLPHPMLMLHDVTGSAGQWLFDHSALKPDGRETLLAIVVSDAIRLQALPREQAIAAIVEQIRSQTQRFGPMPTVRNTELIIEKRATFAAVPGLRRPSVTTAWPALRLAGDWTNTGYPGVLEGAVRSGLQAAHSLGTTT